VDDLNNKRCDRVRELLSEEPSNRELETLEVDGEPISLHIDGCSPCRTWKEQTDEIVDMARSIPQFDVSERLTQNILTMVATEDKAKQQQFRWVVYAVTIAMFLYILLFVDALESVWGVGSWVVGLATMLGLKLLVSEPKKERQVV